MSSYHIFYLLQSSKGKRRHSRKDPESEESDSDPDQLTSSRTESSNQLEAKLKHSKFHNITSTFKC